MSRIGEKFDVLLKSGAKALIPYITFGEPDIKTTQKVVKEMERNGADIIELGVPFSDPLADGTNIQKASKRALQRGVDLSSILRASEEIRKDSSIPLVLMSYYNPISRYGIGRFVDHATGAGVDGLIVPDLPPEEAGELLEISKSRDFDLIFLVAPTSTAERIRLVNQFTSGFIYCVSLTGVTGARRGIDEGLSDFIRTVRAHSSKPLAVGFGISTPEQARKVVQFADGVIVGSAIVDILAKTLDKKAAVDGVGAFVRELKTAIEKGA
jgi:tryptophan synthase alpha chain